MNTVKMYDSLNLRVMDRLKEIQVGLGLLITDTVMTNQEGYKREITTDDLNDLTKWMDIIDDVRKGSPNDLKNAALPIFDVTQKRELLLAYHKWFDKWQETNTKARYYQDIINLFLSQ